MKNVLTVSIIIIVLLSVIYSIAWFVAIPKTARALLPYKWRSIALGQSREDYQHYLGHPLNDTLVKGHDEWKIKKDNFQYDLNIQYKGDSVASAYVLKYRFHSLLFSRTEVIAADTVR